MAFFMRNRNKFITMIIDYAAKQQKNYNINW